MKSERQQKILELIREYEIETQEELIFYLNKYGFETTQATVSRDIRELKLTKVTNSVGNYKYAVQGTASGAIPAPKFNGALVDSITKVSFANNIIVLKTFPGLANAIDLSRGDVAMKHDSLHVGNGYLIEKGVPGLV